MTTTAPAALDILAASAGLPDVLTTGAVAVACAVLSVFVVSRRWAFIGEGISHSGFGGAGTVWLLALAFPALGAMWAVYAGVVVACLATGAGIAYFSRARPGAAQRTSTDAVIGIFLVASVAWGLLAQQVYRKSRGAAPAGFDDFFLGDTTGLSPQFALAAALVCAAVVAVVVLLGKEIVYYCFDPAMAEASGVRSSFIHYLLILLVALTIVVGALVAGSVLVTALLVLPGATALLLSDRLRTTVALSVAVGLIGAVVALVVHARYAFLPMGPSIVLAMFAIFVAAYAWNRVRGSGAVGAT